jgi:transglutaminase-like putative cysteine protease
MTLALAIRSAMDYVPGVTEVSDSAAHAFSLKRGVCQDHAHVMIACCRALGVPARYVSGYLLTARDDHIASHAWVDVWLARHERWFAIDVTNGVPGGLQHCRLAVGRDYLDACPIRGVRRGGGAETMSAKVEVSSDGEMRRQHTPRPRLLQQHAAQQ